MSTPSLKFYHVYKTLFSTHPTELAQRVSSQFLAKQNFTCGRYILRVSSTCSNPKSSNFIPCCDQDNLKTRKSNGLHRNALVQPYSTIGENHTNRIALTLPQRFVQSFPVRYHPYLKLSRIDRPIGTWLLFWPSTWGLTVASGGVPDLKLLALFATGAFVMRGAGCTVNDMWDRHIDPQVKRTSTRPLAARQIRMRHATVWLAAQLSVAFGILLQLNPSCFLVSCGALGLVCLYPLAKRVTHWPQAVLGLTFNTGILIGYAAATPVQTGFFDVPYIDPACMSLYLSGILWTLVYDTIYAHQDLQDDTLLGLGSTARRFGDHTKSWLYGFSSLMVSSLTMTGILTDLSWPYYLGVGGVSAHLLWQIQTLNIKDAANCGERFNSNRHIGWLILASLLASYALAENENLKQKTTAHIKSNSETKENVPVTKYTGLVPSSI